MKFQIALFAGAKEMIGQPHITVDWDGANPPTLADLKHRLIRQFPAAEDLMAASLLAVDCQYADDDCIVSDEQELALIPPVSGG